VPLVTVLFVACCVIGALYSFVVTGLGFFNRKHSVQTCTRGVLCNYDASRSLHDVSEVCSRMRVQLVTVVLY
jgi:hypothetical protein